MKFKDSQHSHRAQLPTNICTRPSAPSVSHTHSVNYTLLSSHLRESEEQQAATAERVDSPDRWEGERKAASGHRQTRERPRIAATHLTMPKPNEASKHCVVEYPASSNTVDE